MSLLALPNELILAIARILEDSRSLSRFARTTRHLHTLVMPILYTFNINHSKCSGLKQQLTPLEIKSWQASFFDEAQEDLEEYNSSSELTTPDGLPLPTTEEILKRDRVIAAFIRNGANLNTLCARPKSSPWDSPILHIAALNRNAPAVTLLTKHGADIHLPDKAKSRMPLHFAAIGGSAKIIRFLINKKADVNARDSEGKTPFHFAAEEGHSAALRVLVEAGADINAQDEEGLTALHLMMMNGKPGPDEWCIPALKTLLSFKPDTELVAYEDKKTALQVAALSQRDAHFIDTLLELGEMDLNARTVEGRTPLSCCVEAGDIGFFMKLVRAGADVMTRDGEGRSLLQNVLDDEFCAWECLPTFLEEGLCTLESNAGDGMTVRQFLKEWRWEYTVEGRVRGIEALD